MVEKQVKLDISIDVCPQLLTIQQWEKNSRKLVISLTSNGQPFDITGYTKIQLQLDKPDGTSVIEDTDGDYISVKDNEIHLIFSEQMCTTDGIMVGKLMLFDNNSIIATTLFKINVENGLINEEKIISSDEYNVLLQLINSTKELQKTVAEEENKRIERENERISNENTRQENETNRQNSEIERSNAEAVRTENENNRIASEADRVSSEIIRTENETTRQNNETERETNELIRKTNETARIDGYTKMNECIDEMSQKLNSHLSDTNDPHDVTKAQIGLSEVENKSSKTILSELTKDNVTTALGYTPYTPNEIDNMFSVFETNIDWKESVDTYDDIAATYPSPQEGWTVNVKDTDYTYRYNGTEWIAISANSIPQATQDTDGLLTASDKIKLDGIEYGANKYVHPTTSGNKHIPTGGSPGQILKWGADGTAVWDNASSEDISVTGIKGNNETEYRRGNVNITPDNIGALSTDGGTITGDLYVHKDNDTNGGIYIKRINPTVEGDPYEGHIGAEGYTDLYIDNAVVTGSLIGNASVATKLGTARSIKIGNQTNSFDGSGNITFTAANMGLAPTAHANANTIYGAGTATNYGHVKLSDSYTSSAGAASAGVGASSLAVYNCYNAVVKKATSFKTINVTGSVPIIITPPCLIMLIWSTYVWAELVPVSGKRSILGSSPGSSNSAIQTSISTNTYRITLNTTAYGGISYSIINF